MLRPVEVFNISLILIKMIKYICTSTSIGTGAWAWAWALGHGCEADRHVLTRQRQKSTQIGTSLSIVKKKQYRTSRQWKICIYQLNHIHKWLIFANVFFGCHRVFETIEWNTKSLFSILIVSAGDFQWLNFVQFFHIFSFFVNEWRIVIWLSNNKESIQPKNDVAIGFVLRKIWTHAFIFVVSLVWLDKLYCSLLSALISINKLFGKYILHMRRRGGDKIRQAKQLWTRNIAYSAMEVLDYDIGKCIGKNVVPAKKIALN